MHEAALVATGCEIFYILLEIIKPHLVEIRDHARYITII